MKRIKTITAVVLVIGLLGAAGVVYAAAVKTPAEIVAGLTGKTVAELNEVRSEGKTYGTIAKEAGKLEEFKTQILEQKKAVLDQRVKDGQLTQAQADQIYNRMQSNQASCDGTGNARMGMKKGSGFGLGQGQGIGRGMGFGRNWSN